MLSPKLSLALALGAIFFFIEAPLLVTSEGETGGGAATGPVKIGPLFQCDHDVRGMVYAIHEKKIMITGFEYDGQGPSTWFNGMLKGATAISTETPGTYVQLPSPDGTCERLKKGTTYTDQNVTINLPKPLKEFATIGVYCFQFCNNFGHVKIPESLTVPPAPDDMPAVEECKNTYPACTAANTKHKEIESQCKAGSGREEKANAMIPHVNKMLVGLSIGCLIQAQV